MDPYRPAAPSPTDTLRRLASAHRATDAERARLEEDVIRAFQPMVRCLAGRFVGHGADIDDLMQVGNLAVLKATRGFDPHRGAFQSYAKATIEGELKKYLRDYCWSVKPPRRVQELQLQIMRRAEAMAQAQGALPRAADLADAMSASVSDISEALSARTCYSPSSLDRPVGLAGRPLAESLADEEEPYARVDGWVSLVQICSTLDEEDRTLLRLRFYEGMSQREIAVELGISQMQVSRRLARLLDGLRARALQSEVA